MSIRFKNCACCGEEKNYEGDCPNGCTDDPAYGVAEGAEQWDDKDYKNWKKQRDMTNERRKRSQENNG